LDLQKFNFTWQLDPISTVESDLAATDPIRSH
jgi:hypothetical protein